MPKKTIVTVNIDVRICPGCGDVVDPGAQSKMFLLVLNVNGNLTMDYRQLGES